MNNKKTERYRITIDLAPYPDVLEMLNSAQEATGDTATSLVIAALKDQLPEIVPATVQSRTQKAKEFAAKYSRPAPARSGAPLNSSPAAVDAAASQLLQAAAASVTGSPTGKVSAPARPARARKAGR